MTVRSETSSVLLPRAILLSVVLTGILLPSIWQPVVTGLYHSLHRWSFFRLSVFETVETLLCYITIEPIYTAQFARNPSRRIDVRPPSVAKKRRPPLPKMKRPSKRIPELMIYVAPLLLLDLTLVKKYAGVTVGAIRESGGYPTQDNSSSRRLSNNFLSPTMHNFTLSSPLQVTRALPADPPTSRRILLELCIAFFLYDFFFFAIHIAFHRLPILRRIHGPHHGHNEMHPQVTNYLSVTERVALILLANFSLNIIGSHVLTRTLFIPIFVYLLIEVHSGVELDWQYDKVLPTGWGAGARKHATHHREGKRFFQPFFCWWDNWLEAIGGL